MRTRHKASTEVVLMDLGADESVEARDAVAAVLRPLAQVRQAAHNCRGLFAQLALIRLHHQHPAFEHPGFAACLPNSLCLQPLLDPPLLFERDIALLDRCAGSDACCARPRRLHRLPRVHAQPSIIGNSNQDAFSQR